ncbi:50S ribosomal protein L3 [Trebouxia sp. C0009 RCD-2024]
MEPFEKTYAMIKPDALRAGKAEEICQLIEVHGFTIIAKQKLQLTPQRAQDFYGEHKGKPFFETLVNFMTSGPVYALVLAKQNAIKEWRSLMGPTNSNTARAEKPKSLRALYGTDGTQNATHGSDSPASAAREIRFFFPQLSQVDMQQLCSKLTHMAPLNG